MTFLPSIRSIIASGTAFVMVTGCTTQHGGEHQNTFNNSIFAAAACALAAGALGGSKESVLMAGAACGAAAGIGTYMAESHRTNYRDKYNQLKTSIQNTENELRDIRTQSETRKKQITQYRADINKLQQKRRVDANFINNSEQLMRNIDQQIAENKDMIRRAEVQKALLENEITSTNVLLAQQPSDEGIGASKAQLERQRDELIRHISKANNIEDTLLNEKKRLGDMLDD